MTQASKRTHRLAVAAMLSAVAAVLQFVEFSIPLIPSFVKLDVSDLPELLAAFSLGPVYGIVVTFLLFHMMFAKLVGKQSTRIRDYGNAPTCAFAFFDVKGYVMMAIMMGGGIALREFGIIPEWIIAFMYTGIGSALALAGIGFFIHYLKRGKSLTCPVTKKTRLA